MASYVGVNLQFLTHTIINPSNVKTTWCSTSVVVPRDSVPSPTPPVTNLFCPLLRRRTASPLSPATWAVASSLSRGKTSNHTGRGHLEADSGALVKPFASAGCRWCVCVCMEMYAILKAHRLCCQRCCQVLLQHGA
jgi:hypothetical protein